MYGGTKNRGSQISYDSGQESNPREALGIERGWEDL